MQAYRSALTLGVSVIALAAATALPTSGVLAQEANPVLLGPIVVTGEKVQRDLKDTASSVTVISGQEIETEKRGKDEIRSVIAGTPNVIYADNVSTPIIRGMNSEGPHTGANAFFAGAVPRATINLDGHYLSYNEFFFGATSAWDVESVEVFRGPQTTSQGSNAIGGAITVNTRDPSFTPEAALRLEMGNYGQRRTSLMGSGPITEDLAGRVTFDYSGRKSFIDYVGRSFVQNSIGQDFSSLNARAKLLWVPRNIDGLQVKFTYSHADMKRPSAEGASPEYEDLKSIAMYMPGWDQRVGTAILDTTYDFNSAITFSNKLQYSRSDADRRVGVKTAGDADVLQKNYSSDTRISFGQIQDTLSGFIGLYQAYTDQDEILNQGGLSTFHDRKHNLGVYGEVSWRFDPQWMLTGGLRYQRDQIRRQGQVSRFFANSDVDFDRSFDAILPKVTLSYTPVQDITLGGMISKGYNPGGTSLDFATSRAWKNFDSEQVWNYELFTRASLLDQRLFVTGNVFYMDYTDYQQNLTKMINGLAYMHTISADAARSYGLELSVDYQLHDTLKLQASLGLLRTKFTRFDEYQSFVGNEFARAPKRMLTLGATWTPTDEFSFGGTLRYRDGYYSDTANTGRYEVSSSTLVDLNASYKITETTEIYAYVNNLFDRRAPVLLEPARGDVAFTQGSMNSPRMFGVGLHKSF